MDGEMQKHYVHSVPKTTDAEMSEETARLCIVFRTGDDLSLKKDSGRPCTNPTKPQVRPQQIFGRIPGLAECQVYRRTVLVQMGAHQQQNAGISGNMQSGADAIIVSGKREDGLEKDTFFHLTYAAERKIGALALVKSCEQELPVRVFRSSKYNSKYRAVSKDSFTNNKNTIYRYDGLYKVTSYRNPRIPMGAYVFQLQRVKKGTDELSNAFDDATFFVKCLIRRTCSGSKYLTTSQRTLLRHLKMRQRKTPKG